MKGIFFVLMMKTKLLITIRRECLDLKAIDWLRIAKCNNQFDQICKERKNKVIYYPVLHCAGEEVLQLLLKFYNSVYHSAHFHMTSFTRKFSYISFL